MAGQSGHRDTPSGRVRAARVPGNVPRPIDFDEQVQVGSPTEERAPASVEAPLGPDVLPRTLRTQASYRLLTATGLTGAEAAGVIGYAVGLRACEEPWTLKQVNKVLFLRELYASDDWGEAERKPA
jgi:hypothetical protein